MREFAFQCHKELVEDHKWTFDGAVEVQSKLSFAQRLIFYMLTSPEWRDKVPTPMVEAQI